MHQAEPLPNTSVCPGAAELGGPRLRVGRPGGQRAASVALTCAQAPADLPAGLCSLLPSSSSSSSSAIALACSTAGEHSVPIGYCYCIRFKFRFRYHLLVSKHGTCTVIDKIG